MEVFDNKGILFDESFNEIWLWEKLYEVWKLYCLIGNWDLKGFVYFVIDIIEKYVYEVLDVNMEIIDNKKKYMLWGFIF